MADLYEFAARADSLVIHHGIGIEAGLEDMSAVRNFVSNFKFLLPKYGGKPFDEDDLTRLKFFFDESVPGAFEKTQLPNGNLAWTVFVSGMDGSADTSVYGTLEYSVAGDLWTLVLLTIRRRRNA